LTEDPQFSGSVEVQWRINTAGRVSSANVVSSTKKNRAAEACLLAEILRWNFAPSSEPIVVGAYPFTFDSTLLARHSY
jgi:TonB family protein